MGCRFGDLACTAKELGDSFQKGLLSDLQTSFGNILAKLGTYWTDPSFNGHLNEGDGTTARDLAVTWSTDTPGPAASGSGTHAALQWGAGGSQQVAQVLQWVTWIALAICVCSLIAAGVMIAFQHSAAQMRRRVGIPLLAAILISSAVAIVTTLNPTAVANTLQRSDPVDFVQKSVWWYALAFSVFGIIVGALKMAWTQRAQPGKEVLQALVTFILATTAGVTVIGMLTAASDQFSSWIMANALDCSGNSCFASKFTSIFLMAKDVLSQPVVLMLLLVAVLTSLVQMGLMYVRIGIITILAGMLPLTAAATNTAPGKRMYQRTIAWIVGFILYKPAAAVVYATAFRLIGAGGQKDPLQSTLVGLTLMVVALIALPALMSMVTPAVSGIAAGGSVVSSTAGNASSAMPTGAVDVAKTIFAGGGKGAASSTSKGAAGAAGKGAAGAAAGPAAIAWVAATAAAKAAELALRTAHGEVEKAVEGSMRPGGSA